MNEPAAAHAVAPVEPRADDAAATASFGAVLAAQRERQGISVADMAARLRLNPKQVAAIEAEDLDRLPPGPFVRGFVRNYAKELRIDPAPLLAALQQRLGPARFDADGMATAPSRALRDARRERASRSVVIAGAVGALVAFGVIGWMSTRSSTPASQARLPTVAASAASQEAASTAPGGVAQAAAATTATGGATEGAATVAPSVTDPAAPAAPAAAIRLRFRERAWVKVVQADGRVLLSRNNEAGSEQVLDGKPPFKLVIGNASAVTLEYRGRTIDLKPLTSRNNVARVGLE